MVVVLPTGQLVTVFAHEVMVRVSVVRMVEVDGVADGVTEGEAEAVTGQTVVYREMISVVTEPLAGQEVTVGAQEVMV